MSQMLKAAFSYIDQVNNRLQTFDLDGKRWDIEPLIEELQQMLSMAETAANEAAKDEPASAVSEARGLIAANRGRCHEAMMLALHNSFARFDPNKDWDDPRMKNDIVRDRQEHFDAFNHAIACYEEGARHCPSDPRMWLALGNILSQDSFGRGYDPVRAEQAFKKAAECDQTGEYGTKATKRLLEIKSEAEKARLKVQEEAERKAQEEKKLQQQEEARKARDEAARKAEEERQTARRKAKDEYVAAKAREPAVLDRVVSNRKKQGLCIQCCTPLESSLFGRLLGGRICDECKREGNLT